MKETFCSRLLESIAKNNGYKSKVEMLRDYNFIPTVLTPKHRKIEIAMLLYRHIERKH